MPTDLPKTTIRIITALLKHQATLILGESASKALADTLIDEDIQKRLDDWLEADQTARQLLEAAEQAHIYVQDVDNCPDADMRQAFHSLRFDNLPSIQAALTELPQALDEKKLRGLLHEAFTRDLPNLTPAQHAEGARIYTDALLRSVGKLEKYTSPIILQTVRDNSQKLDALGMGQAEIKALLEKISAFLLHQSSIQKPPSPTKPGDLPPGSYLPFPRNAIFTGRVADLEKLSRSLLDGEQAGTVINQTLTGMGGLGKTQLAVEFACQHGHHFKGVHWLDLREVQNLESQIALCGSKMNMPNFPPTQPEQVAMTFTEWIQNGPRLLILDNFEEVEAANDVLSALRHSNLRLLITSRRADWNNGLGLKRLALDEFSEAESLEFLRNYISTERENDDELKKLARHLGFLPLALELAGRYLEKQPRLKVTDYLAQLDKALAHRSMQNWKVEQKSLTGHDLSLAQTFARSWELVTDETTQNLFICLGYCAPNTPIPYSIVDAALGEQKERCDDCLSELGGLGLLKAGLVIHPLLAEYARGLDNDNIQLKTFSEKINNLANQKNHDEYRMGNYSLYTPILPHIRAVAEFAEAQLIDNAGSLWNSIGYHIKYLADYIGARVAFERALKIDETAFGPDHPDVATDVNNLGGVLQALGDHAGARAAFERALVIRKEALGSNHPDTGTTLNDLGNLLKEIGEFSEAKSFLQEALVIYENAFGPDHPWVATAVNNLGLVLKALGDHAGARAANERALKIDETAFGPDHPKVAIRVNNLGSVLKDLGNYAGARAAYERALKIDEAAFGPDHPKVARDVNNLGSVLKDLGDHAGARAAFERALKIFESVLGEDHPNVATLVNNLGIVLQALGDHAGARAAYERALKIDEAAFGPNHPNVAIRVNNLGLVLQALGDHAGARAAYERALKIFEKFLPPSHPNIRIVRDNLDSL